MYIPAPPPPTDPLGRLENLAFPSIGLYCVTVNWCFSTLWRIAQCRVRHTDKPQSGQDPLAFGWVGLACHYPMPLVAGELNSWLMWVLLAYQCCVVMYLYSRSCCTVLHTYNFCCLLFIKVMHCFLFHCILLCIVSYSYFLYCKSNAFMFVLYIEPHTTCSCPESTVYPLIFGAFHFAPVR